jgi:hypothetical protein
VRKQKRAFLKCSIGIVSALATFSIFSTVANGQQRPRPTVIVKLGYDLELRSDSKIFMDQLAASGRVVPLDEPTDMPGDQDVARGHFGPGNVQVNNPGLDSIQVFPGFRPFLHTTQSETSVAAFGDTVVATYNTSAGIHLIPNPNGPGLVFDRIQLSGFSTSTDGGKTFKSGFFPGVADTPFSFGDPSVDVGRHGRFYFAQLGQDALGNFGITANTSNDGLHWHDAVVVALDNGADKPWLAVGPDPRKENQENAYITWSSFQNDGSITLQLAKSTDRGKTWTSKTIFAPPADADPTHPQNALSFSNPVVDRSTGTLYIPFAHFSNSNTDFLQMMISNDGGDTFHFATFNIAGAPDPTLLPIVQPGELTECGVSLDATGNFLLNLRLTVHAGSDVGGSLTGLRRFVNATRLIAQPALAALDGVLYLAWNTSTSPFFGDPNGTSNIMYMRSDDGGATWTNAVQVNPPGDPHHVHPSLSVSPEDGAVHITYYTQHPDSSLDLVMSTSDRDADSFPGGRTIEVSRTPFALPPTNVPIPNASNPFATTNYDRNIAQCYALGEYQSVKDAHDGTYALWGDTRNTVTEPVNIRDPLSGLTHPQEDVFFQFVRQKD